MLTRCISLATFLLIGLVHASAQTILEGKLINQKDNSAIAYANIGIINTPVGTISNEDGTFKLIIPEKYSDQEVIFSALGFEKKIFPVRSIVEGQSSLVISLPEQSTLLEDVVVNASRSTLRTAEFGNRYSNAGSIYADSIAAGSAMALLIENKYPSAHPELTPPYYINYVKLRIARNTFDNFKVRVRFLEVNSEGLPGNDLVQENIIITSSVRKGWLNKDLTHHLIRLNKNAFFIAFEWILDDDARVNLLEQYREFKRQYPEKVTIDTVKIDGAKIPFYSWHGFMAGTSFGSSSNQFSADHYKSFYRNNSYGTWKRASFVLTARVGVSNQPPARKRFKE